MALGSVHFTDDGKYMAYSLAASGSDWIEWHVRDVATSKDLPDVIKWSKFSGAAWLKDGSGFFYSRYDEPKAGTALTAVNKFQKVYFHELGTPQDADTLVYERKDQPDWGFGADVTDDGRFLLIYQSEGTKPENRMFVKDLTCAVERIEPFLDKFDAEYHVVGNDGDTFYVLTDKDAPRRRVVAIELATPDASAWKTVIPEAPGATCWRATSMVANRFVTQWMTDAHELLKVFALDGTFEREIALPAIGSVGGFTGKRQGPRRLLRLLVLHAIRRGLSLRLRRQRPEPVFRQPKVAFDPADFETVQVFYPSKDGTKIPMFLTYRKGLKMDGANPTYLYGYGGFNISLTPAFSPALIAWMEMGGVFAQPNLRGGGEYGKAWHDAGRLAHKQNVFDDFIAAAEYLIRETVHVDAKARDLRRQQRRAAGRRVPDAAAGPVRRGAAGRRRDGHAAVPQVHDRLGLDVATTATRTTQADFETLLKYSPLHNIKAGHALSADAGHDGGSRRSRGRRRTASSSRRRCRRRRRARRRS